MNKRIIKGITALALTVALCPTVPTLAKEDWKDIYFDFIKSTLKQKDVYVKGVQLSDLNLDGTPEIILYDGGASASYGINIFEIIDSQVELRYGCIYKENGIFNRNYLDTITDYFQGYTPSETNTDKENTFNLRKNKHTNEIEYTLSTYAAATDFHENILYYFYNDIVTASEKTYFYEHDENHNDVFEGYEGTYRVDEIPTQQSEYEADYNEFMDTWQDTGYQIAYRDINNKKMTDSEIKDFLNSYIPERKALGLDISVTVNGSDIAFDQPPVIVDERTLVPLRAIFEALGATVDWNGNTQTVTSTLDNTTVALTIGSNTMYKNGEAITLDVPAQLIGDRTLVPVRAIAEAYGATVDWEQATYTVKIQK